MIMIYAKPFLRTRREFATSEKIKNKFQKVTGLLESNIFVCRKRYKSIYGFPSIHVCISFVLHGSLHTIYIPRGSFVGEEKFLIEVFNEFTKQYYTNQDIVFIT